MIVTVCYNYFKHLKWPEQVLITDFCIFVPLFATWIHPKSLIKVMGCRPLCYLPEQQWKDQVMCNADWNSWRIIIPCEIPWKKSFHIQEEEFLKRPVRISFLFSRMLLWNSWRILIGILKGKADAFANCFRNIPEKQCGIF